MSRRPKPYETAADRVRLQHLPGDEPPAEDLAPAPPPREFALDEISLVDEEGALPASIEPVRKRSGFWSAGTAFALAFTLFALGVLGCESIRAVLDALVWWAPSGILLGLLLAGLVVTGLFAIGAELRTIRRQLRSLGRIEVARKEADFLRQSRGHDQGIAFAARVTRLYEPRPAMAEAIRDFRQSLHSNLRDHEVVARLSAQVLRPLDEEVRERISRAMRDTAFISLASPNGLVGRLSANAADALYTSLRTARLGLYAMETCRPVALLPEERRGMWTLLRKGALSVLALLERGEATASARIDGQR